MAANFSELTAEVEATRTVNDSAIALLNGIGARIEAAVAADNLDDNTHTAQLAADFKAEREKLAAAVTANTPTP